MGNSYGRLIAVSHCMDKLLIVLLHILFGYSNSGMKPFRSLSAVEQLAAHLREEIRCGRLDGIMPGAARLVRDLGVGTKTAVAALEILRQQGILEVPGRHRRNRIVAAAPGKKTGLRVSILLYERNDAYHEYVVQLGHLLEKRGHHFVHAAQSQTCLKFDVKRVARMVEKDDADAWVVLAGSQPVLEWFAARPVPVFAMFGRRSELPIASLSTMNSPFASRVLQRLVDYGHRRIVLLAREERRKPTLGLFEQRYLEELDRLGIKTSAYNMPDWQNNRRSFHQCLDSLFRLTPPSALLFGEPALFFAAQHYLSGRGLAVPRDLSLVVFDDHPAFEWFEPEVSRLRTDIRRWIPRVVRWVDNVANGRQDQRETIIPLEFIEGGTIGPASTRP